MYRPTATTVPSPGFSYRTQVRISSAINRSDIRICFIFSYPGRMGSLVIYLLNSTVNPLLSDKITLWLNGICAKNQSIYWRSMKLNHILKRYEAGCGQNI